ncbi:hypothetical protein PHYBLDRAFT_175852 [Phycomyces blakesleeanus NRRL 1555(-)]|uniref:OTU domain-containing protein n=1 Tax=Phycomyces blakesleeanus (strain ATCC 8743b / DSM 1359 / FGSC 10004 / NBRC 33097 / NRRL 1555) TaxID=763407 RepID=A0A162N459_PHYB8|nr:hypothetical protein PHYBLDRAFT_175852 [Phycomyces blakesleeanus NRRL 1555(-)]OAD65674.1 hypothetical protein PHYBLDRAFT_175852 [Phycomyces blakesleeanus NRRL 1555(-)]|eukprot:XP_018283714.1 hypothetical protein PHYBLDRAFT_175852 [Phycomyces blakesleeanus NRRL 1555(-)]
MKDKENWVNMYVYKYSHFGNRTSNRAESAHASLKHSLGTSSGKLMTVTLKVKKWYQELVDDRKCRLMTECLGESTEVVFDKVNGARLNDIYHLTINNAEPVSANIAKITTISPQFDHDLELVHEGFHSTHSKQEQIDIHNLVKNILEKMTKQKLEDLNGPTIVEAIKGQPKNTKPKEQKNFALFSRKQISSTQEQKALQNITNLGLPIDHTILTNLTIAPKHITKVFSPEADGNCGYRAIAMEIYQDQKKWLEVKENMLEAYLKYQHTYYQGRMENGNMPASTNPLIIILKDKRSPLPQQHWFGTIDHPQLAADVFNRSVAVYWNTPRETGDCLFVPLTTTPEKFEPIIIILYINHFLLAKRKPIRNFTWPKINPFHKAIVKRYGLLWGENKAKYNIDERIRENLCRLFISKENVCLSNLYHDESSSRSIVLLERSGKTN